jgi:hypothetical protein
MTAPVHDAMLVNGMHCLQHLLPVVPHKVAVWSPVGALALLRQQMRQVDLAIL